MEWECIRSQPRRPPEQYSFSIKVDREERPDIERILHRLRPSDDGKAGLGR